MRETCPFFAIILRQTGLQRTDCVTPKVATAPAFLRRAHEQSGFKEALGEGKAIKGEEFGDGELTFIGKIRSRESAA
jgi:hypothetical protein